MNLKVMSEKLRTSATEIEGCASVASDNIPTNVSDVADALPGSLAGAEAANLSSAWKSSFDAWIKNVKSFGEALTATATDFEDGENDTAEAIWRKR